MDPHVFIFFDLAYQPPGTKAWISLEWIIGVLGGNGLTSENLADENISRLLLASGESVLVIATPEQVLERIDV